MSVDFRDQNNFTSCAFAHISQRLSACFLSLPLWFSCLGVSVVANQVAAEETLTVASRINTPPFVFGEFQGGIDMEIVAAIENHSNLRFKYIHIPRNRILAPFAGTELDGYLIQPLETHDDGCMTNWYVQHMDYAVTLKDKKINIQHVNDLGKLKVISFDGATKFLTKVFRDAVKDNPHYIESYHQRSHIQILYKGRFDAIVGDSLILKYHQKNHFKRTGEYHEIETHDILPPIRLSARFKKPRHCTEFNKALAEIRQNGVYDEIFHKYENEILEVKNKPQP